MHDNGYKFMTKRFANITYRVIRIMKKAVGQGEAPRKWGKHSKVNDIVNFCDGKGRCPLGPLASPAPRAALCGPMLRFPQCYISVSK